jgi:16S rRNA (cytosine1402-N4)-methyltransferase
MAVNQEVEVLKSVLESATSYLGLHGRLSVISFHSGEDRIVKQYFQTLTVSQGQRHGPERYLPVPAIAFKKIKPYPILPSEKEMKDNHRSESAVLRIIERVIDEK